MAKTSGPKGRKSSRKKAAEAVQAGGISEPAVTKATGKSWKEWFALLDEAGAKLLSHRDIASLIDQRHEIGGWWSQMVTVAYEQARGLRQKHEKPDGFSVSASKTIVAPVQRLYRAFASKAARARWLPDPDVEIRKATPHKSMRITWVDGRTSVEVNFYSKGADKCQAAVQHGKLENAAQAKLMKAYWRKALAALQQLLEG